MTKHSTEKLYINDSYLNSYESNILEASENYIILDKTVFYAASGGQPGDTGKLIIDQNEIEVIDTVYDGDFIKHIVNENKNLKQYKKAKCLINWQKRYSLMKVHSCLHLLCALIKSPVTGGSINIDRGRLDFDLEEKPDKEKLSNDLQSLINNNYNITSSWISDEELDKNPNLIRTMSVKPPRGSGKIRMIKIGDNIDYQPCGGTHVKNTSEIGNTEIIKIENKGKRNKRIIVSLK
tara:strand:+ start:110 stop:817 length:708 start_codon:yes stop_codon:yes gene_type:complete